MFLADVVSTVKFDEFKEGYHKFMAFTIIALIVLAIALLVSIVAYIKAYKKQESKISFLNNKIVVLSKDKKD